MEPKEFEQETDLWHTGFEDEERDLFEDDFPTLQEEEDIEPVEGDEQPADEEPIDEPSNTNEEDLNVAYFLANALKEQGIINLEEIPEDIDESKIFDLYKESHRERLYEEVQNEIVTSLQTRGITDEHLTMAMAIQSGYNPEYLLEQNRYKSYASISEDADENQMKTVVKEWYEFRGLFEDEINEKLDELELDEEKLKTNFKRAQEAFKTVSQEFDKQVKAEAYERERLQYEAQQKNQQFLQNVRTTGELAGEKMTKPQLEQFEKGLFVRDQVLEIQGQPYQVSKFDKFIHEIQNNFETQLLAYKLYTMRDLDKRILEQQTEGKVEEKLLSGLKTALEKRNKGTISKNKEGGRSYEPSRNARVFNVR